MTNRLIKFISRKDANPINQFTYCNHTPSRKARASPPARAPRSPSSWSPAWSRCPPGDPSACSPRTEPQSPAQQTAKHIRNSTIYSKHQAAVLAIRDILVRIRIHTSDKWIRIRLFSSMTYRMQKIFLFNIILRSIIFSDPVPDPGGPKTCGSRSPTLLCSVVFQHVHYGYRTGHESPFVLHRYSTDLVKAFYQTYNEVFTTGTVWVPLVINKKEVQYTAIFLTEKIILQPRTWSPQGTPNKQINSFAYNTGILRIAKGTE